MCMVAERLVELAALILVAIDHWWIIATAIGLLSILWIGASRLWVVEDQSVADRWKRLVRKVIRIRRLRRVWANLGHHLQQWRQLKDKEQ